MAFFRFSFAPEDTLQKLLLRLALSVVLVAIVCRPAVAATISFATVMQQAVRHSYALKIAGSDVELRRLDLREARSRYLPTLSLRYDFGYVWALSGQEQIVTIGDSVSANNVSTWQNSLSLTTSLPLFDFGARQQKIVETRHGIRNAELTQSAQLQKLRLSVLDTYAEGLRSQCRLRMLGRIVTLRKKLYRAIDRLHRAGLVGCNSLNEAALHLAADLTRFDDGRADFIRALTAMTELTGERYLMDQTIFSPLPTTPVADAGEIVVERLPQVRALDEDLARLRAEREASRRGMLPTIDLYGNYRLYGADQGQIGRTVEDLSRRDASVAVALRWEFFSGFRDRLKLERIDVQMRRVSLQRQQKIAELHREIDTLRRTAQLRDSTEDHLRQRWQVNLKAADDDARLRTQGVLAENTALEKEIDLMEDILDADLLRIKRRTDAMRLRLWQQEAGS